MATRAIIEVEINDDAFRSFQEKFNSYQEQLKTLPGEWGKVSQTMSGLQGIMDKINVAAKAGPDKALVVGKVFVDTKKITTDFAALWVGVSKSSHFFLHDVIGATQHLAKWGALTGVFSGLLAGGGLFGISRLAMHAAGQRQSAMGLGVTPGEMSSFLVNVGTLTSDPSGLLSKFSEGFYSAGAKNDFAAAFGSGVSGRMRGKDAASFFADILPDLKRKLDAVPESSLGNYLKSSHLLNRGIDTQTANNIRAMSPAQVASLSQRLGADARDMAIPSDATKKLQDLDTKLLETWTILQTDIERHLTPLTPSLTSLTTSFGKFADKALESGGAFDVVVKEAGDGIDWLAGQLGTTEGREKLIAFGKDAAYAAATMELIAKAISGATAVSSAYGAWKMIGGVLSWIPAAAIGAAAGYGLGSFLSDPLYHLGGNLAHPNDDARRGVPQQGAAEPGSPWNRVSGGKTQSSAAGPTPSQNERAATSGTGARTQTPQGPGSPPTPNAPPAGEISSIADSASRLAGRPIQSAEVQQYISETGRGHPSDLWCADFVGAALDHAGYKSLRTRAATDYLRFGMPVGWKDIKRGDVIVEGRGLRAPHHGVSGHVAIAAGPPEMHHGRMMLPEISGDWGGHGGSVSAHDYADPNTAQIRRPVERKNRHEARLGMHPADVALRHRRPEVEIAMNEPGEWTVS